MRVAVTIDTEHPDRPCSGNSLPIILESLRVAAVTATFFVQGRWARSSPEEARAIAHAGHLIGNHSHYHAPMDALTEEAFADDLSEAEVVIREVTGKDPRPWFRCPFGAGMHDPDLLERLDALGYRHVGWDVDPNDWSETRDAAAVEAAVVNRIDDGDAIVLLHSWPDATAVALPRILDRLGARGAEFVTVDALAG
jgi:peptidoglycan/xylan/chitin deacetylase (PgdA/CDA1 family)